LNYADILSARHTSKVSQKVLQDYNEMIQTTAYNLEIQLRRIDERIKQLTAGNSNTSGLSIDLKDEKEVTKQCLRICKDARSYIESLSDRESTLLQEAPQNADEEDAFEAQLRTRQALDKNLGHFVETIGHLQRRLDSLIMNEEPGPGNDDERLKLEADIDTSKQCLDVCKAASEVTRQKVFRIGEVIADGSSDQVVVTTLADLFDIKKALSKDNSAQLVGSMDAESLRNVTDKRYGSRFGAVISDSDPTEAGASRSPLISKVQKNKQASPPHRGNYDEAPGPSTKQAKPSSNEVRKRFMGGSTD
jgi:hypothetical protein